MKTIRKIVGWFLVIFAGLWALSGFLCAVFALLGLTEVTGFGARLGYTAVFLVMTALSLFLVRLGWKLREVHPKQTPPAPAQAPVPEQKPAPKPRAEVPKPKVEVSKPAPVKQERTPLHTWVTGPGLCHDRFPYPGFGEWHERLDSCRSGATCHVYNGEVPLRVAIQAMVNQQSGRWGGGIHVRLPSAGALEYLDDSIYAQKWESPDAVPVMELGCEDDLLDLCREHGVRIVTYEGPRSLFDHVNNCRLRIHEEEGYGSVDDAATVGMWWVEKA